MALARAVCDDWHMSLRLVVWPAGLAVGVVSLAFARDDPAFTFAGTSLGGDAGPARCRLGAPRLRARVSGSRRPGNAVGPLLAAASGAWFLTEWDNPGVGSAAAFTVGLVLYAACPALLAWAMLAYPSGRLASWESASPSAWH